MQLINEKLYKSKYYMKLNEKSTCIYINTVQKIKLNYLWSPS